MKNGPVQTFFFSEMQLFFFLHIPYLQAIYFVFLDPANKFFSIFSYLPPAPLQKNPSLRCWELGLVFFATCCEHWENKILLPPPQNHCLVTPTQRLLGRPGNNMADENEQELSRNDTTNHETLWKEKYFTLLKHCRQIEQVM